MSISVCTRCLSRLQLAPARNALPITTSLTQTSSLHTTASLQAAAPPGPKHKLVYRNLRAPSYLKKRKQTKKLPAIGERRQQRNRIVLSNANALEVNGLEDLNLRNFSDEKSIGRVLAFDGQTIDKLREIRGFKKSQSWGVFRRPASLMRKEIVEIGQWMASGTKDARRVVVTGEKSSGKSVFLSQAMAMALMKGWVVINIPEAQEHTMNHFAYAPLPKTADSDTQLYSQATLAAAILERTAKANATVLAKIKPTNPPPKSLGIPSAEARTLHSIASFGAQDPNVAHEVFTYFLEELTQTRNAGAPPTLFTVDNLNYWMGPSKYRSADYKIVHAHQLAVVRSYLSLLFSGKQKLANGGLIMAATTGSNQPTYPSFDLLLKQVQASQQGIKPMDNSFPLPSPYQKVDSNALGLLDPAAGTEVMALQGVSKEDVGALMQYYVLSGVLKEDVSPENISEKWTLSGGGNVGELCRWGERARVDPEKLVTRFGTNEGVKVGQGEHRPRG